MSTGTPTPLESTAPSLPRLRPGEGGVGKESSIRRVGDLSTVERGETRFRVVRDGEAQGSRCMETRSQETRLRPGLPLASRVNSGESHPSLDLSLPIFKRRYWWG